ncbi:4882_t:CDS:2 [Funneliformis geosporum]|uniref:11528_t:CDS:1 n=1 Tax=Funneliformis geosporum TaxID=1117311 RepID=A0A9W4WTZ5_9GLOM|nr:4882_t:CDS:2 [Funneliformis geosporum]CAI2172002.1 11528_t:CDS:2 [Funneliformis geosporum]
MLLFDEFFDVLPHAFSAPSFLMRANASYNSIPLNVSSTSTHYIIRTELPGIPQNKISVEITDDGVLSIQAERHLTDEKDKFNEGEENEIMKESWVAHGKLLRNLKFQKDSIDVEGIKAELNNGELIIKS